MSFFLIISIENSHAIKSDRRLLQRVSIFYECLYIVNVYEGVKMLKCTVDKSFLLQISRDDIPIESSYNALGDSLEDRSRTNDLLASRKLMFSIAMC